MKRLFLSILAAAVFLSLMTGCSRTEFTDLLGFTERFTYSSLAPEDFFIEKNDNGSFSYYTFFEETGNNIMLKIICSADKKAEEIRIYLPKFDENANNKTIAAQDISLFLKVTSSAIEAFTGYKKNQADEILNQMQLYEKKSYENEGELTKTKNKFHFIFHSAFLGSEFIINNTYLKSIPSTEKPESKPLYGDTTRIRTETVPTK